MMGRWGKKILSKLVLILGLGAMALFAIPAALCLLPLIAVWRGIDALLRYLEK